MEAILTPVFIKEIHSAVENGARLAEAITCGE
jgi:hypothetical protein